MKRVHFVCIGNCCRSQMAEGFARHLAASSIEASSSGLAPTREVAWETLATMRASGVDISSQYPKKFDPYGTRDFDLIINMSGFDLPGQPETTIEEWTVRDPYGESAAVYAGAATDIESRIQSLIQRLTNKPE